MKHRSNQIGIVGTGFVADLYMRSLKTFPELEVVGAYDIDQGRLTRFCEHWRVPVRKSISELLDSGASSPALILNLTNPSAHFEITKICLEANKHVYSEKPLATDMQAAQVLYDLAAANSLMLASAPCSILSETAQTLWLAVREQVVGPTLLVYAHLDDDFIPKAPYQKWHSESGAPWPYRDEFLVGCTLEHAGYYLTWLMAMFGSVDRIIAASANVIPDKLGDSIQTAPDYSSATLFFKSGVVASLTCSIVAPHDHSMRIIGSDGILEVDRSWDNAAPVRFRKRYVLRRRLVNSPIARRYKILGPTHPKVQRWGAAVMNFALGPAEMCEASREGRRCRLTPELALHLNEVTLALQNANGAQQMRTICPPLEPMTWARANRKSTA